MSSQIPWSPLARLPLLGWLAALVLAPSSAFADVRNLAPAGQTHVSLQAAIDAANEGDTLLLSPGTYAGFDLNGKGLTLLGAPHGEVLLIGTSTIQNIASTSTVQLRGLTLRGRLYEDLSVLWPYRHENGVEVLNTAGPVRFFDCDLQGGNGKVYSLSYGPPDNYPEYNYPDGGHGLVCTGNNNLALLDCRVIGGAASGSFDNWDVTGGIGGHGLLSSNSAIAIYDSLLIGGKGGHGGVVGSDAGDALQIAGFGLFASGCEFLGGDGGGVDPTFAAGVGDGGAGLRVALGTNVRLLDNLFDGGDGGCCSSSGGAPGPDIFYAGGPLGNLPGTALSLRAPQALAADGESFHLQVQGTPGQRVFLVLGAPTFEFITSPPGIRLVPFPSHFDFGRSAVIGPSGSVDWFLPAWELPAGTIRNRTAQAFVRQGSQFTAIGGAVLLTAIDDESGVDCNGNGVHDVVDVVLGSAQDCNGDFRPDNCSPLNDCNGNGLEDELEIDCAGAPDTNGNQIPDECENYADWFVDVNAPAGGNGSASAPFKTLSSAFLAAESGHSISVAPGTYSGAANRELNFGARDLTLFSTTGSAQCIIDLQQAGEAFRKTDGAGRVVMRGFTIQNAANAVAAFRLYSNDSLLEDCVFRNNDVVALQCSGTVRLNDCSFLNNDSSYGGSGLNSFGPILAKGCIFGGNTAGVTGAAARIDSFGGTSRFDHCVFRNNTANTGGAIALSRGDLQMESCHFKGNIAQMGGVFFVLEDFFQAQTSLTISSSTLADNQAIGTSQQGAVLYSANSPLVAFQNSILWNNASAAGTNIFHAGTAGNPSGSFELSHCNIQFGLSSVVVNNGSVTSDMLLASDPLFMNPALGDYRLSTGSPCIDAGSNFRLPLDFLDVDKDFDYLEVLPQDLLGQARQVDDPSVPDTGSGTAPLTDMGAFERP